MRQLTLPVPRHLEPLPPGHNESECLSRCAMLPVCRLQCTRRTTPSRPDRLPLELEELRIRERGAKRVDLMTKFIAPRASSFLRYPQPLVAEDLAQEPAALCRS